MKAKLNWLFLLRGLTDDSGKENLLIKIEITDTGKGIPIEMQEKLFEPFYQVEDDDTRTFEGTGLGLPICKELTSLLGW
jgi:signal transduction histidine kinase